MARTDNNTRENTREDTWDLASEFNFSDAVYTGERNEAGAYLTAGGWRTDSISAADLLVRYGLTGTGASSANFADVRYITAVK